MNRFEKLFDGGRHEKVLQGLAARATVQPRDFLVTGLALLVAMHVAYLFGAANRGAVYIALQVIGLLSSALAFWGARQGGRVAQTTLAAGLGGLALIRILQTVLGLSRLDLWLQYALFAALVLATLSVALGWSSSRFALWSLAVLHFFGAVVALGGGRLPGLLGLLAGTVGFSLIAPNLPALSASPSATTSHSG